MARGSTDKLINLAIAGGIVYFGVQFINSGQLQPLIDQLKAGLGGGAGAAPPAGGEAPATGGGSGAPPTEGGDDEEDEDSNYARVSYYLMMRR